VYNLNVKGIDFVPDVCFVNLNVNNARSVRYFTNYNFICSESTVYFGLPDTRWHFITLYRSAKCMVSVSVDGMALPVVDISGGCTDITFNSVSITAGITDQRKSFYVYLKLEH
jgi:hypothetical protein